MAEAVDTAAAESALGQMGNLKSQILSQSRTSRPPAPGRNSSSTSRCTLVDKTDDLNSAVKAVDGLLGMKDQLVVHGDHIADARKTPIGCSACATVWPTARSRRMAAESSAARMMEVQKKLAGEDTNLAESIKSVETLIDFQHEFQKQIRSLDSDAAQPDGLRPDGEYAHPRGPRPAAPAGTRQPAALERRPVAPDRPSHVRGPVHDAVSKNETGNGPDRPQPVLGPSQYNHDETLDDSSRQ